MSRVILPAPPWIMMRGGTEGDLEEAMIGGRRRFDLCADYRCEMVVVIGAVQIITLVTSIYFLCALARWKIAVVDNYHIGKVVSCSHPHRSMAMSPPVEEDWRPSLRHHNFRRQTR